MLHRMTFGFSLPQTSFTRKDDHCRFCAETAVIRKRGFRRDGPDSHTKSVARIHSTRRANGSTVEASSPDSGDLSEVVADNPRQARGSQQQDLFLRLRRLSIAWRWATSTWAAFHPGRTTGTARTAGASTSASARHSASLEGFVWRALPLSWNVRKRIRQIVVIDTSGNSGVGPNRPLNSSKSPLSATYSQSWTNEPSKLPPGPSGRIPFRTW